MTDNPEQTCTRCRESWPETKQFFSVTAEDESWSGTPIDVPRMAA